MIYYIKTDEPAPWNLHELNCKTEKEAITLMYKFLAYFSVKAVLLDNKGREIKFNP